MAAAFAAPVWMPPRRAPQRAVRPRRPAPARAGLFGFGARPEDPSAPLLEMRGVHYTVPTDCTLRLLVNADFTVNAGELVVVVGENGCGKSTLLSLIVGLAEPDRGKIRLRGRAYRGSARMQRVAMVMQRPRDFFIGRSVVEEVVACFDGATPNDVRAVMGEVGLLDVSLLGAPDKLSGGQAKRLALAVQLMRARRGAQPPALFLLDEPMAGVDAAGRLTLARVLARLARKYAVVVVSHQPAEMLPHAHRVVQLARGTLHEVDRDVIDRAVAINRRRADAAMDARAPPPVK